ncbi:MAG: segregation and condensation protein A [Verrucomicrobiota bacterium]
MTEQYKVELEVFEGPLDLLLYLIKKEEVDVYDIPVGRITNQYMEYLKLMEMLDLNIAGEFIVMAATLMMIKSRMLLPVEDRPEVEEEEEDPRWDLVRQLVEYKKFKDAANSLQEKEELRDGVFGATGTHVAYEPEDTGSVLQDVSIFDLISAFREVLRNAPEDDFGDIYQDRFTVADKIDYVLEMIRANQKARFSRLFSGRASRHEIICTFLALLELLRLRQIGVAQEEQFGEIVICRAEETDGGEYLLTDAQ